MAVLPYTDRHPMPPANVLLAALLDVLGDPPLIPVETLERHMTGDPATEVMLEHRDEAVRVSLRRRETLLDRAERALTAAADDGVAYRKSARMILEAIGADPDRLAP